MQDPSHGEDNPDQVVTATTEPRLTRSQIRIDMNDSVPVSKPRDVNSEMSSSQSSSSTVLSASFIKRVEEEAWVQCEKADCLKWRRISKSIADSLGETEPWYCHMNSDTLRNTCQATEEDYRKAERLLKKCKLKYKFSALEDGTLVWAKMTGFCKWPSIITPDPSDGRSRSLDTDDEPLSYHVEFFGMKHSHGWVHTRFVELYGKTDGRESSPLSQNTSLLPRIHKTKSCLRQYGGNTLNSAVEEANVWLKLTHDQRLQRISYIYRPREILASADTLAPVITKRSKRRIIAPSRSPLSSVVKIMKYQKNNFKRPISLINKKPAQRGRPKRMRLDNQLNYSVTRPNAATERANTQKGTLVGKIESPDKTVPRYDWGTDHNVIVGEPFVPLMDVNMNVVPHWAACEDMNWNLPVPNFYLAELPVLAHDPAGDSITDATSSMLTSPRFCLEGQSLKDKLDSNNSLLNRTKEEKFTMDIEMFIKNQEEFEHDVRKFLKKHGCTLRRMPTWHDVPVTLYQIFLAVYDRGGFVMASKNKQWAAIYRELAGGSGTSGAAAKSFYQRYLLPYELYLKKQEYKHVFRQTKNIQAQKDDKNQTSDVIDANKPGDKCADDEDDDDVDDGFSSCSELGELNTMLDEMENLTNGMKLYPDHVLEGESKKKPNMDDIKLKFYDDSPSGVSLTMADLTEFKGDAKLLHTGQRVDLGPQTPHIDLTRDIERGSVHHDQADYVHPVDLTGSDMFSLSGGSAHYVLEELATLQKELERFGVCNKTYDDKLNYSITSGKILDSEILDIDKIIEKLSQQDGKCQQDQGLQVVPEATGTVEGGSILTPIRPSHCGEYATPCILKERLSSNFGEVSSEATHCVPAISVKKSTLDRYIVSNTNVDITSDDNMSTDDVLDEMAALQEELDQMDVSLDI